MVSVFGKSGLKTLMKGVYCNADADLGIVEDGDQVHDLFSIRWIS